MGTISPGTVGRAELLTSAAIISKLLTTHTENLGPKERELTTLEAERQLPRGEQLPMEQLKGGERERRKQGEGKVEREMVLQP
jgi:hypothetical protein